MARLLIFLVIGAIALIISIVKSTTGKVTGNHALRESTVKAETAKVMDKTARGLRWMDKQWEESKSKAQQSERPPDRNQ